MTIEINVRGILRPKKVYEQNETYVQNSRAFLHLIPYKASIVIKF